VLSGNHYYKESEKERESPSFINHPPQHLIISRPIIICIFERRSTLLGFIGDSAVMIPTVRAAASLSLVLWCNMGKITERGWIKAKNNLASNTDWAEE